MSDSGTHPLLNASPEPKDLFLCHTGTDKPWVEDLAQKVESVPYKGRFLRVVFDKWDFAHSKNIVLELEREIDSCRYIAVILSKASVAADWPTLERTIAVHGIGRIPFPATNRVKMRTVGAAQAAAGATLLR